MFRLNKGIISYDSFAQQFDTNREVIRNHYNNYFLHFLKAKGMKSIAQSEHPITLEKDTLITRILSNGKQLGILNNNYKIKINIDEIKKIADSHIKNVTNWSKVKREMEGIGHKNNIDTLKNKYNMYLKSEISIKSLKQIYEDHIKNEMTNDENNIEKQDFEMDLSTLIQEDEKVNYEMELGLT